MTPSRETQPTKLSAAKLLRVAAYKRARKAAGWVDHHNTLKRVQRKLAFLRYA